MTRRLCLAALALQLVAPLGSLQAQVSAPRSDSLIPDSRLFVKSDLYVLAGFAADGTMYFESIERGASEINGAAGPDAEIVYAYDPKTEEFTALTDNEHTWRLYAVPPRRYESEHGELLPWAIVAIDGFHAARPDALPPVNPGKLYVIRVAGAGPSTYEVKLEIFR